MEFTCVSWKKNPRKGFAIVVESIVIVVNVVDIIVVIVNVFVVIIFIVCVDGIIRDIVFIGAFVNGVIVADAFTYINISCIHLKNYYWKKVKVIMLCGCSESIVEIYHLS